jgi:predicted enzyme related to lactoylglutathione lyase
MSDPILGRPLWYELMTTDMKAAEAFYTKAVGWTITPFQGLEMPYDMWTRAGNMPVGGVMTLPDELKSMGVPPHWMMYIGVTKLEDGVSQVERLGGGAVSPVIDVPKVGRMRVVKDPQGAAFSLYEPSMEQPPEAASPEIGDVSWHELYTTDAPAALSFYRSLFGWQETEAMDMGAMGKYHMFGRGARTLGGMMNRPPEMAQVPPHWGLYFRVPDVHAAAERVKANGGRVLNGPMEVPGGDWIVNCMDPQGAAFSMHHKKP